jgi:hypothetical protein
LVKQFFTILQELDQFFIFIFQLLYFFDISPFFIQMFVNDLLLLEEFGVDHIHVLGVGAASVRKETILTS